MLADLYVNFHQLDQVEFMIFKDRLRAAILVANSTRQSVDNVKAQFEQQRKEARTKFLGGRVNLTWCSMKSCCGSTRSYV